MKKFINSGQFKKGMIPWNKGIPRSEETKKKISEKLIGKPLSLETRQKLSEYHKANPIKYWLGKFKENHPHWIKDRSKLKKNDNHRIDYAWINLRTLILKRDHYRCMDCGEIKKGEMEVNHIFEWADYPRLRYESLNLETLCKQCHRVKTNAYMRKDHKLIYN